MMFHMNVCNEKGEHDKDRLYILVNIEEIAVLDPTVMSWNPEPEIMRVYIHLKRGAGFVDEYTSFITYLELLEAIKRVHPEFLMEKIKNREEG